MEQSYLFDTKNEAKACAEGDVIDKRFLGWEHVFVYKLGDKFGRLWHHEDKYIFSFLRLFRKAG